MIPLAEKVLILHKALETAGIPHAFGGALALAYGIEHPRATNDIDTNVWLPTEAAREVLEALPAECAWSPVNVHDIERHGQTRVYWDENPIDLFLQQHEFHDSAHARVREVPLLDATIPVISATDLSVFKALFNRPRDWPDIQAMLQAGSVDVGEASRWIEELLGADSDELERFRELAEHPGTVEDETQIARRVGERLRRGPDAPNSPA